MYSSCSFISDLENLSEVQMYFRRLSASQLNRLGEVLGMSWRALNPDEITIEWLQQALSVYTIRLRPTWRRLIQAMREAGLKEEATMVEYDHLI